ncbi:MAG: hypothetical protein ACI835_002747 [Planctomycetota bacterium]|jgi:hypothetical protein
MLRNQLRAALGAPIAFVLCLTGGALALGQFADDSATTVPTQLADDAQPAAPVTPTSRGEQLGPDALGAGRIVDVLELHELEKLKPIPHVVQRLRNGAHGVWAVPSKGGSGAHHSGSYYIVNKWGDTSMGIGFGEPVMLEGAWMTGQTNSAVSTTGLVVVGYRDGVEVARSETFTDFDERPTWFAMDLADVDRVVFEAEAVVSGAGWYGLDDLTFTQSNKAQAQRRVLDFEDLDFKYQLTGSSHAGLTWEVGTGSFDTVTAIDQPLTNDGYFEPKPSSSTGSFMGGGGTAPNLIQSFEGTRMFDPGAAFLPPDTCGAVGIDHFVEVVNTNFSVYERATGNRVVNLSMASFFGVGGNPGDPRVVYDHHSQRWFVLATNFNDRIYVAASTSSDPTGTFYTTHFLTSQGIDSGKFPDYETLGVDANGIYTAAAMFSSGATMTIFALDKAPLIAGSPSLGTVTAFRGLSWEGAIQPTVTHGNPGRQYFVSLNTLSSLRVREITPPLTSPTMTDLGTVSVPSFSQPPDAPSLGSTVPLDSVDYRPMNSVYRAGSIWTAHSVDVSGRSAVRWYEIDASSLTTSQIGTIDSPDMAYLMPSIAVNSAGDAVLGFSGAVPTAYAAAYFTGRLAGDPPGQVGPPVLFKAGESAYEYLDSYGRNRWGDYSLVSIDPNDDLTFWTVQEYARTSGHWGTWIAELQFPSITDCNNNGIEDVIDIANATSLDCNLNGIPDECDIADLTSQDCNNNGIPDECELDCDNDGVPDDCEADCNNNGTPDDCESITDCNNNGTPDECEPDCDNDGTPDDCEVDCNNNGTPDDCESFSDCNNNGIPDDCDPDCDNDGTPDDCEADCNNNGAPDDCESITDCNNNGIPDECEPDCDNDGTPDDCEADCNNNGTPDDCESITDCNNNGIPDECEPDCDNDGTPDDCEADCNNNGTPDDCESITDCNNNGIPDECEPDCDNDGTPDDCEVDCNNNGTPDDCESITDCNNNGIPDECEPDCDNDGTPDDCETDCNNNGTPDDCESITDCNNNGTPDDCESLADCNNNGTPDDCEVFTDCNNNGLPDECDIASGFSDDDNGNGVPDECECLSGNYCVTTSNSVGSGATIWFTGSTSISANDLTLRANGLPIQQFGIFYYGPNQLQAAFGEGFRCVGGSTTRLPVISSNIAGNVNFPFDIPNLPPTAGAITPGSNWNFQFWYRDPAGGGSSFNLTDALELTFCD